MHFCYFAPLLILIKTQVSVFSVAFSGLVSAVAPLSSIRTLSEQPEPWTHELQGGGTLQDVISAARFVVCIFDDHDIMHSVLYSVKRWQQLPFVLVVAARESNI